MSTLQVILESIIFRVADVWKLMLKRRRWVSSCAELKRVCLWSFLDLSETQDKESSVGADTVLGLYNMPPLHEKSILHLASPRHRAPPPVPVFISIHYSGHVFNRLHPPAGPECVQVLLRFLELNGIREHSNTMETIVQISVSTAVVTGANVD
jgi:hypothetical protein